MKKKLKKLIAGMCAVLTISGFGLVMTGCSMTEEQETALNAITSNTETLVESFGSYLEGQNNKLDKQTAYDMLKHAKLKSQYILEDSEVCDIYLTMEDSVSGESGSMHGVYDFSTDVKKIMVTHVNGGETITYVDKYGTGASDNSYTVTLESGKDPVLENQTFDWYSGIEINIDALAQAGIFSISLEDVTRVVVNEDGEYTFTIMRTILYKDAEEYTQDVVFATIVVKDYLFKSVDVQLIRKVGSELSFSENFEESKIEDGYGSYIFSGEISQIINLKAEYRYGKDVSLAGLNSKIQEFDAKIASGEWTLPQGDE